jgi:hypothetical protein
MSDLEELEEYFKTHPKHLRETKRFTEYMAFEDPSLLDKYKENALENSEWEVIVDDWNEGESFFGAVNCNQKKVITLDYPNIAVWFEIHSTEETLLENISRLEQIKKDAEERDLE